jgi:hypothetical protein
VAAPQHVAAPGNFLQQWHVADLQHHAEHDDVSFLQQWHVAKPPQLRQHENDDDVSFLQQWHSAPKYKCEWKKHDKTNVPGEQDGVKLAPKWLLH